MELYKLKEKLEEFAELEGSEAGEYWSLLCSLASREDCLSDQFKQALIKEMEGELRHIDATLEIVEETVSPSPYKVVSLREKHES